MAKIINVSTHALKTMHTFIKKEYGAAAKNVWKTTIREYKRLLKAAPDYGGKKSPHFKQIYDALFLLAFCSTAPKDYTIEELEPLSFEIFMSPFNTLGKVLSARNKWTMALMAIAFKISIESDNRHSASYPADFTGIAEPYDKKNGIIRYCFTRCPLADFVKNNGLDKWMPLMCNCDHTGLGMIHAGLIRESTCFTGDKCEYCIVSDNNKMLDKYELIRSKDGLLISRKKVDH